VITHRITAIITYWNGSGWARNSPGSIGSSSDEIVLMPARSSAARSSGVPGRSDGSSVVTVEMSSLLMGSRPHGMR